MMLSIRCVPLFLWIALLFVPLSVGAGDFLNPKGHSQAHQARDLGMAQARYSAHPIPRQVGPFTKGAAPKQLVPIVTRNLVLRFEHLAGEQKGKIHLNENFEDGIQILEDIFNSSSGQAFFEKYPHVYVGVKHFYLMSSQVILRIQIDPSDPKVTDPGDVEEILKDLRELLKSSNEILSVHPQIRVNKK